MILRKRDLGGNQASWRQFFQRQNFDRFFCWKRVKSPVCNPMLFKLKRVQDIYFSGNRASCTKPTLRRAMMAIQAGEKVED